MAEPDRPRIAGRDGPLLVIPEAVLADIVERLELLERLVERQEESRASCRRPVGGLPASRGRLRRDGCA